MNNATVTNDRPKASRRGVRSHQKYRGHLIVDEKLIDEAVVEINRIDRSKRDEIVRFILDKFFGGDIKNYNKKDIGSASFFAMQNRGELEVRYSTLMHWMNQEKLKASLPDGLGEKLKPSQLKELVPLKSDELQEKIAHEAVDNDWTVAQLADRIKKALPPKEQRALTVKQAGGRIKKFAKTVAELIEPISSVDWDDADDEDRSEACEELDETLELLQEIRRKMDE